MDWLNEILKDLENKDELAAAISKELPKHFKPASVFNETNEKLKDANGKLTEMKDTIDGLSKSTGDIEDLKTKLQTANTDLETFKTDTNNREVLRSKKDAYRKIMLSDEYNVNPKALDVLEKSVDFDKVSIDTNGEFIGLSDITKIQKENNDYAFIKTTKQGTLPGGAMLPDKGSKATMIEAYNQAEKARDVAAMSAIQQQINNLEE